MKAFLIITYGLSVMLAGYYVYINAEKTFVRFPKCDTYFQDC